MGQTLAKTRCVGSPTTHRHRGLATTGFPSDRRRSLGLSPLPLASPHQPRALRSFHSDQPRSFTPFGPSIQVSAAASRLPPFALPHHAHPHFPQSVDARPASAVTVVVTIQYFPAIRRLCSLIGYKLIYPIRLVLGRRTATCRCCGEAVRSAFQEHVRMSRSHI